MVKETRKQIVTKKHLARIERERLQRRYILIGSSIVIALVVVLIGYGIVQAYILQPRQPVATVNDETITTRQFQANGRFARGQLIQQYLQYQQLMELFGGSDTTNQSFFQQNLTQITTQLQPEILGQNTIDGLIADRLIRQEAAKRQITVTSEEIDQAVQSFLGYYPGGTPTAQPTLEAIATSTLSPLQLTLVPPTPTVIITATPTIETPAAIQTPTATSTPDESVTATPTSAPSATPTEYTEDAFNTNVGSYLDYVNISEQDLREILESQLYRERVFAAITADVKRTSEQVWARHILVADETTAKEVQNRLDAGEDFALLATEYSTDTLTAQNGGDLDWFGVGDYDPEFEKIAFNTPIGAISPPTQTNAGWEIIFVLGHEERPISDSDYQQLLQDTFDTWLTDLRTASTVEIYDNWQNVVPLEPALPVSQ